MTFGEYFALFAAYWFVGIGYCIWENRRTGFVPCYATEFLVCFIAILLWPVFAIAELTLFGPRRAARRAGRYDCEITYGRKVLSLYGAAVTLLNLVLFAAYGSPLGLIFAFMSAIGTLIYVKDGQFHQALDEENRQIFSYRDITDEILRDPEIKQVLRDNHNAARAA